MVVVSARILHNLADRRTVVRFKPSTQSVYEQFLGEGVDEQLRTLQQRIPQPIHSRKLTAVRKVARSINGVIAFRDSPAAYCIEILEREAHWIHEPVAAGARLVCPVLRHTLP